MKHVTSEDMERLKGEFTAKYGFGMDSLMASILNEIKEVGEVYTPFTTNNPLSAFAHGLGKNFWLLIGSMSLILGVYLHHLRETTKSEYSQIESVVKRYPNLVKMESVVKNARFLENREGVFLQIDPAQHKLTLGNSYTTDPNKAMPVNSASILIPVLFK